MKRPRTPLNGFTDLVSAGWGSILQHSDMGVWKSPDSHISESIDGGLDYDIVKGHLLLIRYAC
jgi:hypothetical protein